MKKNLSVILAIVMVLTLVLSACGQASAPAASTPAPAENAEPAAPAENAEPAAAPAEEDDGPTLSLNLSSPVGDTHPAIQAYKIFAEEVKEGTNGKITINVYPNGALGDQADGLAGLKLGTMDMQHCNAGPVATVIPEFDVFNLPYIFKSGDHIIAAMNGEVGDWVRERVEAAGFHYLGWIYGGSRSIITDVGPIEKPADLNGLKIRVMSSDTMVAMINAMGGIGTPMAQSEVYSALQQGVIDGWENSVITLQSLSLYEVSQYFSRTEHLINPDFLFMSQSVWDSLSAHQQQVITEAMERCVANEIQFWLDQEADTEAKLLEEGVSFNDVDKDAFVEACQPLWDAYIAEFGEDNIQMIQNAG